MDCPEAISYMAEQAKKKGAEQYDIAAGEAESTGLDLYEGQIRNTEISNSRGIGIRLFMEGRPGYAFTEKLSAKALSQCVDDACAHARLTDPLPLDLPSSETLPQIDLKNYSEELEAVSVDQMLQLGLEIESLAAKGHSLVENIPYLGVGKSSSVSWISNSKGVFYSQKSNSLGYGIGVVAGQNGQKKMGVYGNTATSLSTIQPSVVASMAVERSVELLGAESVESGTYPIVLSHRVSSRLFTMYCSPFYAESVQKGQSKLRGKLGEKIGSEFFNLRCDPHLPGFPGSRLFDGEGVATQTVPVVVGGVLNHFLYNLESARKDSRAASGHGVRGYSGQVGTGFSNYVIPPGKNSLQEILSMPSQCLYVVALEGGSGCSPVSGEISIGAQGFLVKNGEKIRPVEGITLSSNFFELLNSIEGLSDTYSEAISSARVPDILLGSMHVAG